MRVRSRAWILLMLAGVVLAPAARAGDGLLAELPFLDPETGGGLNRVFLDLAPEGNRRAFRVFLDTGAGFSVFSPLAARENGVRVRRVKSTPYRRKTILGRDLQFWVDTRSSDTGTRMGWSYGLLGGNMLEEFVFEIDFPGRRVRFFDPGKVEVPETVSADDEAVLPLRVDGRRPSTVVLVNGVETPVLLDTGAPHGIILSGEMAKQAGVESSEVGWAGGSMVLGPVDMRGGEADVGFGPLVLDGAPAFVAPRGLYNWAGSSNSLVGYDLLSEFVVRFDYRRGRMWLKRVPGSRRTLYGGDWALFQQHGALLAPRPEAPGEWLVVHARADSVAARRGVQQGDVVPGRATAEEAIEALGSPTELTLRRPRADSWDDVTLPAPEPGGES
jgi:predicted aspartyl protease